MAKKLSVTAVLLLVVVPLCAYTCVLLVGVQLGRAVERSPAGLGVHPVLWQAQKTPDCAAGGVRCTLRGAIDYITKELIWDDTNNVSGFFDGRREREAVVASRSSGVQWSSSSKQQQPYVLTIPPPSSVDDALPSTQRYHHNNHTSPRGVISVGPWGGSSGGQRFYMHGASAPRLRSIILYHSGAIHSLTVEYSLAGDYYYGDGRRMMPFRVAGPWGRPDSFGSRGVRVKIELRSGEYITAMSGTTGHFANVPGVVITSLTFRTSAGRTYGPYGSVASGLSSHYFSVPAADGACIVGFWGRSGWLIDAIGVYMKPSCSSSSSLSHAAAYKNYSASRRQQGSNK